jgi:hypothetical protein
MLENSRHLETFHLRFPSAWWTIAIVFFYYDFLMLDLTLLLMCQKKIVIFILEDINFEIITRKRGGLRLCAKLILGPCCNCVAGEGTGDTNVPHHPAGWVYFEIFLYLEATIGGERTAYMIPWRVGLKTLLIILHN